MRYLFDCIWHYLSSHSRHGTHSPFVYGLADKAIYQKGRGQGLVGHGILPSRYRGLLLRILNHLGKKKIICATEQQTGIVGDVLFLSANDLSRVFITEYLSLSNIMVVDGIYNNKKAKCQWQVAVSDPQVTVAIDLFYFGLLLKRSGQYKEHFKLRYPY